MPWTIAWLLPLCGLIGGCRPGRPPHRWLPSGNTGRAPWRKHVRPSVHAWGPAAEKAVVDFCDRFRSWMSVDLPPNDLFQDTLWMWASLAALQKVTSADIELVSGRVLQLF